MSHQQQPEPNSVPGLSEREIQEILSSSGVINGEVTNAIKLASAIADIIVTNNQLLIEAIRSGNYNAKPLDDGPKNHQTAQPTEMWELGPRPQSGM